MENSQTFFETKKEVYEENNVKGSFASERKFKDYWEGEEKELEEIKDKVFIWMEKHCSYRDKERFNKRE